LTFDNFPFADGKDHFALIFQGSASRANAPLVRVHSECVTGDLLGSLRCDCGQQLREALTRLSREGGVLIYLRQEGRGIGLHEKIRSYALQDDGLDTFEANVKLGHQEDSRSYTIAAEILKVLDIAAVRLLTLNPEKVQQLSAAGIDVVEQVKTQEYENALNHRYLRAKEERALRSGAQAAPSLALEHRVVFEDGHGHVPGAHEPTLE
jgi:GTP cyclohydrolase II